MTKLKKIPIIASCLALMVTNIFPADDALSDVSTDVPPTEIGAVVSGGKKEEKTRVKDLRELFRMAGTDPKTNLRTAESRIAAYTITDLTLIKNSEFWRPYERYFEAHITNGAVEIVCAQQGANHLIRNFSPETLDTYGTEPGYPFNDPVAPYHDANYEFRTLSQDVPFIYTYIKSGMALQCQLRRDDKGNPGALFIHRFTRLIVDQDLLSIELPEVDEFFRTFGAFAKIACGAQEGKGNFYYVWAQRKKSDFTKDVMARTFNLLIQEEKRNKSFYESEQTKIGIHPAQRYDLTLGRWANLFMLGYNGANAKKFTYNDPTAGGKPQGGNRRSAG